MWAAAFHRPARSYKVTEVSSIVAGDRTSVLIVKAA
jgi:hypothetical protein